MRATNKSLDFIIQSAEGWKRKMNDCLTKENISDFCLFDGSWRNNALKRAIKLINNRCLRSCVALLRRWS